VEATHVPARTARILRTHKQLAQFCTVGALGLVVNILVYAFSIGELRVEPAAAATLAFLVAVTHNYLLNRRWTFRGVGEGLARCGSRFLAVSLAALGANLILLGLLDRVMGSVPAQLAAVILVTPISFLANKWWSFRARVAPMGANDAASPGELPFERLAPRDVDAILRRASSFVRRALVLVVLLLLGLYASEHPAAMGEAFLVIVFGLLTLIGASTVSFMLYAWREADSLAETEFAAASLEPCLSFSLIVPARHEESVLGATVDQLARLDHPSFEVLIVVGHDDPETQRVAVDAAGDDPRFRIVVDRHDEKNKPKALNVALPHCGGDVVGVFDAEDVVATGLLRAVDQAFQATGAQIVQGATQLTNYHSSWFAARNVLEYYFWFKSRLHYQAKAGFIPLGGNTVFVRRSWLDDAGGWDESCLAEDCDLGARLSARRARTVVAYTPALVTREETPETVAALVKQRTRWNQGFLQVLRKGDWRALPFRARLLATYTLAFPFLQAASALVFPFTIAVMIGLGFPIELGLLSFLPLVPLFVILAVELAGLRTLGGEFGFDVRARDYVRLLVGMVPYQLLLCLAALRAVWRELRGIHNWEKTAHAGAHL
jgi:cellulose synthase/poly-beta-1,6-N-acetylglucosamine synthase-like glycosyltransferase/putative flippase GtrA